MTHCYPRPRMRWNGAIGAIARCKRVSTVYAPKSRSRHALRSIWGEKPKAKGVSRPSKPYIKRVQDESNPVSSLQCQMRDCSEDTGLPPTDVYRKVRVRTFEPGGQPDVRSRCIPTRPERRDHGARSPAAARDRPVESQRHAATVSALWSLGLSGQAVSSDAARLGRSRRVVSA